MLFRKLVVAVVAVGAVAGAWQALGAEDAQADPSDKIAAAKAKDAATKDSDPYLWLANIHGQKALGWVKIQNAKIRCGAQIRSQLRQRPRHHPGNAQCQGPHRRRPTWRASGSSISGRTRPMCAASGGAPSIAGYNAGHPQSGKRCSTSTSSTPAAARTGCGRAPIAPRRSIAALYGCRLAAAMPS